MDLALTKEHDAFRAEVRAFLAENLDEDLKRAGRLGTSVYADYDVTMRWHKILHRKGWLVPSWPEEYGGTGWDLMRQYIFASELSKAGAPSLSPMGVGMIGPALIGYGSQQQKEFYLPRIRSGEDFWCQGYSEPGSGSDLASLQMKAEDKGDHFICSGSKIWTTHANYANRIFCLVRTDGSTKPQEGITFVLIDMDQPGVSVEPLLMLTGEHIQNQVFFDNVKVPKENVVGEIHKGWTVAKYLLQFERGNAYAPGLYARLNRIRAGAAEEDQGTGAKLIDDPAFAAKLAEAEVQIAALEFTEHRILSSLAAGDPPGAESSMLKTRGTEVSQHLTELGIEAAGFYGMPFQPHYTAPGGPVPHALQAEGNLPPVGPERWVTAVPKYFNDRAGSIYAGSNEIQRNIMSKAVLGL
ncbi:acyl-CoA dehydrogenase family protein [Pyruvatibacter mobilis]|uniref:acyl-CoA dehydrogenase family protein n=1 Tax=Pyruvatibacter mobilis TaxID=1712261 RepID=UPI003BA95AEA